MQQPSLIINQQLYVIPKLKKQVMSYISNWLKNWDIAFEFGEVKRINQLSIGFALVTNNEMKHGIEKLQHKNFDMVVLNSMNDAGATFEHDTNKVTILKKDSSIHRIPGQTQSRSCKRHCNGGRFHYPAKAILYSGENILIFYHFPNRSINLFSSM